MTHKWNYQPITPEQAEASQQLAQELGISPILEIAGGAGITTQRMPGSFSAPTTGLIRPIPDEGYGYSRRAPEQGNGKEERILVYGDYDVDGTTAVALVYKFIQQFYSNIDYYIPDRYNEGMEFQSKE